MPLPLLSIPAELLPEVHRRMTPPTFCRLRQTCREMDEIMEKNRFRTKSLCNRNRWMLIIAVGEENKVGYDFEIVPYSQHIVGSLETYRSWQNNNSKPHGIIDPYVQLSGMKFHSILVHYSSSPTFFESYSFKRYFLPLMKKLRLECKFLTFYDPERKNRHAQNLIFQNLVRFSYRTNYTGLLTSEYRPIKTFKIETLGSFLDKPTDLGSMIRHLEHATLGKAKDNPTERFVSILEDFLEEVCKSKTARNNLKELTIETAQFEHLMMKNLAEITELWQGRTMFRGGNLSTTIMKLPIDAGTAIILKFDQGIIYNVRFLNEYNRKELYNILHDELFFEAFKSPGVHEAFFAAEDDIKAMEALNPPPGPAPSA